MNCVKDLFPVILYKGVPKENLLKIFRAVASEESIENNAHWNKIAVNNLSVHNTTNSHKFLNKMIEEKALAHENNLSDNHLHTDKAQSKLVSTKPQGFSSLSPPTNKGIDSNTVVSSDTNPSSNDSKGNKNEKSFCIIVTIKDMEKQASETRKTMNYFNKNSKSKEIYPQFRGHEELANNINFYSYKNNRTQEIPKSNEVYSLVNTPSSITKPEGNSDHPILTIDFETPSTLKTIEFGSTKERKHILGDESKSLEKLNLTEKDTTSKNQNQLSLYKELQKKSCYINALATSKVCKNINSKTPKILELPPEKYIYANKMSDSESDFIENVAIATRYVLPKEEAYNKQKHNNSTSPMKTSSHNKFTWSFNNLHKNKMKNVSHKMAMASSKNRRNKLKESKLPGYENPFGNKLVKLKKMNTPSLKPSVKCTPKSKNLTSTAKKKQAQKLTNTGSSLERIRLCGRNSENFFKNEKLSESKRSNKKHVMESFSSYYWKLEHKHAKQLKKVEYANGIY